MNKRQLILLEGEAGGAGGGGGAGGAGGAPAEATMESIVPKEFVGHASLASIKSPGELVKSFVNAQSLIGVDKMARPNDKWTDAQWGEFYGQTGRPDTPGDYKFSDAPEGMEYDSNITEAAKVMMHKQGLSNKQADSLIQFYMNDQLRIGTEYAEKSEAERVKAVESLKREWGPAHESRMEIALGAVQKFASEELQAKLADSKWGNDPEFIKLFYAVGERMMEDSADGRGDGLLVTNSAQAEQEIKALKSDADFLAKLHDSASPGHKEAVDRWELLHKKAYPSK